MDASNCLFTIQQALESFSSHEATCGHASNVTRDITFSVCAQLYLFRGVSPSQENRRIQHSWALSKDIF